MGLIGLKSHQILEIDITLRSVVVSRRFQQSSIPNLTEKSGLNFVA
jgi:hypothetical protein